MEKTKIDIDEDLKDLIPQFLENRKRDVESLLQLSQNKDLSAIVQLAHKVKGTAAGYGFTRLSELAHQMEQLAKKEDSTSLPELALEMKRHFDSIDIHFVPM